MDKLRVIFCVRPLSISFISFDLRLFCAENLKRLFLFFPFFLVGGEEGMGTEEVREHPLGLTFQEFIFCSGRKKEISLPTWIFHNLALL